jgi:negative regulator of flagellin synthesis FlgM
MTDAINTQNRPRATGVSADTRAGSTAKTSQQGAQGKPAASTSDEASIVELSSARLVEALSEQIRNLPEVNEARIEAVKQALGNGEYQPDAEVIARKYSEIEKLLP